MTISDCIMVEEHKATLTYTQLLKEDLGIFRLVPEDGVIPDYKAGQFFYFQDVMQLGCQ